MLKRSFSSFCSWLRSQISDCGILGFIAACVIFIVLLPVLVPFFCIQTFNDWSRTWFKEVDHGS